MNEKVFSSIYAVIKKLNTVCATVSGIVLLFVTFSIFVDVFLRYFLNRPSIWITEVSTYLFLYIIFLGTAYALQQGVHINVTFFLDRFEAKTKRVISLLTSFFAMVFTLILLWQTSIMTWEAYRGHWTSPTMLNAPYLYIYVVMVFGTLTLFLTFLFQTLLQFKTGMKEKKEP
jgi:TRAP-type C4-dicarboxylate transport system permease small subunit